jgi:hypothetical protein
MTVTVYYNYNYDTGVCFAKTYFVFDVSYFRYHYSASLLYRLVALFAHFRRRRYYIHYYTLEGYSISVVEVVAWVDLKTPGGLRFSFVLELVEKVRVVKIGLRVESWCYVDVRWCSFVDCGCCIWSRLFSTFCLLIVCHHHRHCCHRHHQHRYHSFIHEMNCI